MNWRTAHIVVVGCLLLACDTSGDDGDAHENGRSSPRSVYSEQSSPHDFSVETKSSKMNLTMDAELERIRAVSRTGLSGGLHFVPDDLRKCRGRVQFDLLELELTHATVRGDSGKFGEMLASRKQNDDMRAWLEISPDTPPDMLRDYRFASFEWDRVRTATPSTVPKAPGRHTVEMEVVGRLSLHGKHMDRIAFLDVTVERSAQGVTALEVSTKKPLVIDLEEHDVRPRSAFGVLADRTLDALGKKVAKKPEVDVHLLLRPSTGKTVNEAAQ